MQRVDAYRSRAAVVASRIGKQNSAAICLDDLWLCAEMPPGNSRTASVEQFPAILEFLYVLGPNLVFGDQLRRASCDAAVKR
jgi:hypothetical protein